MNKFKITNMSVQKEIVVELSNVTWRTFDGSENNLFTPYYGMSNQNLVRKSPASYYQSSITGVAVRGISNPSPRLISNEICQGVSTVSSLRLTDMTWIWGQFVDHEIDLTPDQGSGGETLNMSTDDGGVNEPFPGRTIKFTRSLYNIKNGVREQANIISSFIDATNVYGTSMDRVYALRLLDGSGKLKSTLANNSEVILPYNTEGFPNAPSNSPTLFLAGDIRANENVGLISMHTVFMREHNRLCDVILQQHPEYVGQDETIFQYARRMVIGMMQNITYNEFLPALLGSFPAYSGYSHVVNPNVDTEFSTVGYRLGHTMLSENIQIGTSPTNTLSLVTAFFNPSYIQTNGINNILIGASLKLMQEIDGIVVEAVRSFLFGPPTSTNLLDLAALNIQRGRDHGIPGYNAVRVGYGLPAISSFGQLPMPVGTIAKLSALYDSVDNIDPWIGVIAENHLPGKSVGPLANAILVNQFTRLRDGDRYWFQNDEFLTPTDISVILNTKLSDILSRNTGYTFRRDVFHV